MSQNEILRQQTWLVERHIKIEEVEKASGAIVYHVEVWDGDRKPFISRWFNDPTPAYDFTDRFIAREGVEE